MPNCWFDPSQLPPSAGACSWRAGFAEVRACAEGLVAPLSPPYCQFHCSSSVCGAALAKVSKHLWAAAHIPEGQKELNATKDDFNSLNLSSKKVLVALLLGEGRRSKVLLVAEGF